MRITYGMKDRFTLETLSDYMQTIKSNGFKPTSYCMEGSGKRFGNECTYENKETKRYIFVSNYDISFEGFTPEEALNFYQTATRCSKKQEPEYPDIEDDEVDR